MIKICDGVFQIKKQNGIFLIFNEYEKEEDFSLFIDYICNEFGATQDEVLFYPYSLVADLVFLQGKVTAMYQSGLGCLIKMSNSEEVLLKYIVGQLKKT